MTMAPPVPELTMAERKALDAIGWPLVPSPRSKFLAQVALDPEIAVRDAAEAADVDRDLPRKWRARDDDFARAYARARNGGDPREPSDIQETPGPDPYYNIEDPEGSWLAALSDADLRKVVASELDLLAERRLHAARDRFIDDIPSYNGYRERVLRMTTEMSRRGMGSPLVPEKLRRRRRRWR